jgi:post-segregation antitoxin (ccd killing protein)
MTTITLTVELPDELAENATALGLLESDRIAEMLQAEIERQAQDDEDDAEWEAMVVTEALGDALMPDGSIDFAKLDSRTKAITLVELFPEGDAENEG